MTLVIFYSSSCGNECRITCAVDGCRNSCSGCSGCDGGLTIGCAGTCSGCDGKCYNACKDFCSSSSCSAAGRIQFLVKRYYRVLNIILIGYVCILNLNYNEKENSKPRSSL